MNKPIILIGNGGHSAVLTEILLQQNRTIIGFTATELQENRLGLSYLGTDDIISTFHTTDIELVLGIGSVNVSSLRATIFNHFKQKGYTYASVIHEKAIVSPYAHLGEGVQLMAGSIIQSFTTIADNTIVNTSSSVDHDCYIGSHCHIAPGSTLSGSITVGSGTHIGAGVVIIQNVTIGSQVLIGAGSLVLKSVNDYGKVYGVPAKEV
jgi:sugar O-acyltransferase (sialic acid O-acetyltransferase NeuD family)